MYGISSSDQNLCSVISIDTNNSSLQLKLFTTSVGEDAVYLPDTTQPRSVFCKVEKSGPCLICPTANNSKNASAFINISNFMACRNMGPLKVGSLEFFSH